MAIEKQKLILIGGVVLGVVAIVMTKTYLDQQQQLVREKARKELANIQANQTSVLIARQDISEGEIIEAEMLEASVVPNKFIQPQAVTSLDRIAGMVTIAPISRGEQIILSKLTKSRKEGSGGDLSGATPSGKRAITIVVDNIASLSGMVKAGNYVDVLAMLQIPVQGADGQVEQQMTVVPLFQNVLVLAIGSDTGGMPQGGNRYADKNTSSDGNSPITLALDPQEANLIAFVQEQGKIRLVMRSPADAKVEQIPPATWETLFQYIAPQREGEKPIDTTEYVEIVRGLNKEKAPLLK